MATIERYETASGATRYRVRYRTPDRRADDRNADSRPSGMLKRGPISSRSTSARVPMLRRPRAG